LDGLQIQVVEVRVSVGEATDNSADGIEDKVEDVSNEGVATTDLQVVASDGSSDEAGNTSRQGAVVVGDIAATAIGLGTHGVVLDLQATTEDGGAFDIARLEVSTSESDDVESVVARGERRSAVSGGWGQGREDWDAAVTAISSFALALSLRVAGSAVVAGGCWVAVFARVGAVEGVGSSLSARSGQDRVSRAVTVGRSGSGGNSLTVDAVDWWWRASVEFVSTVAVGSVFILVALAVGGPEAGRDVLGDPRFGDLGTDGQGFGAERLVEVAVESWSSASETGIVSTVAVGVMSVGFRLALPGGTADGDGENLVNIAWGNVADVDLLGSVGTVSVGIFSSTVAVSSGLSSGSADVLAGFLVSGSSTIGTVYESVVTTVATRTVFCNIAGAVGSFNIAVFLVLRGGGTVIRDLPSAAVNGDSVGVGWVSIWNVADSDLSRCAALSSRGNDNEQRECYQ